jgi:hypothetical protein
MTVGPLHSPAGPYARSAVSGFGASPFGGLLPFGSFGPPVFVGLAPPPPLLLPYGASGAVPLGTSLRATGGSPVSAGTGTDEAGNPVVTATLGSSKGGIIAFQSTRPPGFTPDGTPPGRPGALPTLTDAAGKPVPYGVGHDEHGAAVLHIQLTDRHGRSTTLYSTVDAHGYPATGGPATTPAH